MPEYDVMGGRREAVKYREAAAGTLACLWVRLEALQGRPDGVRSRAHIEPAELTGSRQDKELQAASRSCGVFNFGI
jgi:hypothetical protein